MRFHQGRSADGYSVMLISPRRTYIISWKRKPNRFRLFLAKLELFFRGLM